MLRSTKETAPHQLVLAIRQMKSNKAAGLDSAITAEALQNGDDAGCNGGHSPWLLL